VRGVDVEPDAVLAAEAADRLEVVVIVGTMLVLGGLAILISWLEAWSSVASWFSNQSVPTLTVAFPAAIAIAAAVATYPGMRRLVP